MKINWIERTDRLILVGATDEDSWNAERELGGSGVDARTLVGIELHIRPEHLSHAIRESAFVHAGPGSPEREDCFAVLPTLAHCAWAVHNRTLDAARAHEAFFGYDV